MKKTTKAYIRGTLEVPAERRRAGRPVTYKHFSPDDTLYYYDRESGKHMCLVDDKSARGFVVTTDNGKQFLPHDYQDLLSYETARILCHQSGVFMPKPHHKRDGRRCPPPLFAIDTPLKTRPAWNRSAILRHIDECLRRKNA
jgi:hypothetical protein